MPKRNTQTPPPTRDIIITRSHAHTSTLGEQITQGLDVVPTTPGQEQTTPSDRYVLVSPILGPITFEQLLKGNPIMLLRFEDGSLKNIQPGILPKTIIKII